MTRLVATSFGDNFAASRAARRRRYTRDAEQYNAALERDGLSMATLRQLQARRVPIRLVVGAVIPENAHRTPSRPRSRLHRAPGTSASTRGGTPPRTR